jgi:hypothetical protein
MRQPDDIDDMPHPETRRLREALEHIADLIAEIECSNKEPEHSSNDCKECAINRLAIEALEETPKVEDPSK